MCQLLIRTQGIHIHMGSLKMGDLGDCLYKLMMMMRINGLAGTHGLNKNNAKSA